MNAASLLALILSVSLKIIEFGSALNLLFLATRWTLRHTSEGLFSLAVDVARLRSKFRSLKNQSKLEEPERGL